MLSLPADALCVQMHLIYSIIQSTRLLFKFKFFTKTYLLGFHDSHEGPSQTSIRRMISVLECIWRLGSRLVPSSASFSQRIDQFVSSDQFASFGSTLCCLATAKSCSVSAISELTLLESELENANEFSTLHCCSACIWSSAL